MNQEEKALISACESIGKLLTTVCHAFCLGERFDWMDFLIAEKRNKLDSINALDPASKDDVTAGAELGSYILGIKHVLLEMEDMGRSYAEWQKAGKPFKWRKEGDEHDPQT